MNNSGKVLRAFIAIELDKEIQSALLSAIKILKKKDTKVSWAKPPGIHLTLKFLGKIKSEFIPEIESVLKKTAKKHTPFSLCIKRIGTFPLRTHKPRIIWAGIEENEYLVSLHEELDKNLIKLGFPGEKRKFHPHLTLGRIKSYLRIDNLLSEISKYQELEFGKKTVSKIVLYESILKPSGAEYTKIIEQELA
jgi:2'-5' RNA ligase